MYWSSITDTTVSISNDLSDAVVSLTYPTSWMAVNAYCNIRECCNRFSKEPDLHPHLEPRIYVFGEMNTWQQYIKRLMLTAEKIGAIVHITTEKED